MTTGSTISRELAGKRSEVERKMRGLASKYGAIEKEIGETLKQEARLWERFAAIQIGEASSLPTQIEGLLDARQRRIEQRQREADEAEGRIKVLERERKALAKDAELARRAFESADEAARLAFEADPEATALRVALTHAREASEGLAAKYQRAQDELRDKGHAYEQDELFAYLSGRGHGTPAYRGWGLAARVDSWLAGVTGHRRKAADYGRLKDIPRWIMSRLEKARAELEDSEARVVEAEQRHFESARPAAENARAAQARLAEADKRIEAEQETVHAASAYLADAARAADGDMQKALKSFTDLLSRKGIKSLQQAAKLTASDEDDRIVEHLGKLAALRGRLEEEADTLKPGIAEFERRISAIADIEKKLKARGWTGSDDRFSGRVGTSHVDQLGDGLITAAALWSMLQSAHQAPRSSYGSSPSWGSSSSGGFGGGFGGGGSSSGGGFGGGSWSSGGGFGGGGSSTGGGF